MRYHHLIFDIDGTLIDTKAMLMAVFSRALKKYYGVVLRQEQFDRTFGLPCEDAFCQFGLSPTEDCKNAIQEDIRASLNMSKIFEGVPEVLASLKAAGMGMSVVTSKNHREYENSFVPFGLHKYFSEAICADDTTRGKPYPDPLLLCLERLKLSREDVAYIGDTDHDRQCAVAAGVDFYLAAWGGVAPPLKELQPRFLDVKDLLQFL